MTEHETDPGDLAEGAISAAEEGPDIDLTVNDGDPIPEPVDDEEGDA